MDLIIADQALLPGAVPQTITMRQAKLALLAAGAYAGVQPYITSLADPAKTQAQIAWDGAYCFRADPFVAQVGTALGLSSAQVDQLFITAATL